MWEAFHSRLEAIDLRRPETVDQMLAAMAEHLGQDVPLSRFVEEVFGLKPSGEYAPTIIHSLETGAPSVVYGNVANFGLIDNLPQGCCVEVPCLVDKNGVQPTRIGALPPHLAALMQTNINVQGLTVEAALTRQRQYIYSAAMLDPHTAAELDLDKIWHLVDDLIAAHGDWLPDYR